MFQDVYVPDRLVNGYHWHMYDVTPSMMTSSVLVEILDVHRGTNNGIAEISFITRGGELALFAICVVPIADPNTLAGHET